MGRPFNSAAARDARLHDKPARSPLPRGGAEDDTGGHRALRSRRDDLEPRVGREELRRARLRLVRSRPRFPGGALRHGAEGFPAHTTVRALSRDHRSAAGRSDTAISVFNIAVASIGVFVLLPLFAVLALAVRLSSPGPILYRGARIGRNNRTIHIYKFRTMRVGAEQAIGARLLSKDDRVVTPLGLLMRETKLDELPQLINVLRGEMSLVGPRPVRPIFLDELSRTIPRYLERFTVCPGITGLAQVRGGYYTHPRDKLRYDLLYISRRSLLLDVTIILRTLLIVLTRIATVPVKFAGGWLSKWTAGRGAPEFRR
jgi:lipopolysaccharide/colanic/teichoic acid biosynthesis glycosyltransferase